MSNLIKYQFVNLEGKDAVVINNNKESEKFVPLRDKKVRIQTVSQIEAEKALLHATGLAHPEQEKETKETDAEFKSGLNVTNFDELFHEHQKKAEDKADQLLSKAREEAEKIRNEAVIAVDAARASAYEEGKNQGYQEGMAVAEQEIRQKEEELAESARLQREELEECMSSIEGRYVDIVISLVRKLTGILIEGKEDLILYLIRTAAGELEPSENYRIRVSTEDVYFLEGRRSELMQSLGEDVSLEFVGEKGLEKGQCIIETDTQMADCGFQTQLEHLVQDLRMLVH